MSKVQFIKPFNLIELHGRNLVYVIPSHQWKPYMNDILVLSGIAKELVVVGIENGETKRFNRAYRQNVRPETTCVTRIVGQTPATEMIARLQRFPIQHSISLLRDLPIGMGEEKVDVILGGVGILDQTEDDKVFAEAIWNTPRDKACKLNPENELFIVTL